MIKMVILRLENKKGIHISNFTPYNEWTIFVIQKYQLFILIMVNNLSNEYLIIFKIFFYFF